MTRANVMIVEDETVTAMALEESIRRLGYDVVATVDTGEAAIKTAREQHLDVILMDIRLRGQVDGITAADTIRTDNHVPSIYLTAYSDEETLKRAKVAEPYGYLVKPYNEKELRAAIEIALHNSAMERDRRAAQEAIEARDRTLTDIIDNSPAIIYLKDTEGRYTIVNRSFEATFDLKRADVKGKETREVMPEALNAVLGPPDEAIIEGGPVTQVQEEILQPDGPRQFVAVRFALRRPDGAIYGVCGVLTDVTDLRRTEETLRKTEARYRMIAETTMDIITLTTAEGIITYISPSCKKILGYGPEELVGTDGIEKIHPSDAPRVQLMPPPVSEEWVAAPITFRARAKHGDYVWLEARSQSFPRAGNAGAPLILTVTRDVTDRIAVEQEIQRLNDELEARVAERTRQLKAVNAQLESFTHSISHDLRAPARGLSFLADELENGHSAGLDADGRQIVHRLRSESKRLATLINELLGFTRASQSEIEIVRVDLTALAHAAVHDIRLTDPDRNVTVSIEPGLVADGDELLLKVVLDNLIGNAWKFTAQRPDAKITFGAVETGQKPTYFVRDNGAGFQPAEANRLFQPFQRLHSQSEFPGTGLGLSSVKNIIERHGGRVWAEGRPGEGATFWFTL